MLKSLLKVDFTGSPAKVLLSAEFLSPTFARLVDLQKL
jgi:hypothetical protein